MLNIVYGNIVDDAILKGKDAIVLPTNPKMRYGMGVSEVVFRKAGIEKLERYCESAFGVGYEPGQENNDMSPTEIRVTPGFALNMDIIFAQGPNDIYFRIEKKDLIPLLIKTYENLFQTILDKEYRNVLLPSLGTGHYGFDHREVAKAIMPMLRDFAKQNPNINLTLCLFAEDVADTYRNA